MAEEKQDLEINKLEEYFDRPGILILEIRYPIGLGQAMEFKQAFYRSTGTANPMFEGIFTNTLIPFYGMKKKGLIVKAMTLKEDFKKRGHLYKYGVHSWFIELTQFMIDKFKIKKNIIDLKKQQIHIDTLNIILEMFKIRGLFELLHTYFITIEELYLSIAYSIDGDYWSRHPKITEFILEFIRNKDINLFYNDITNEYLQDNSDLNMLNMLNLSLEDINPSKHKILIEPLNFFHTGELSYIYAIYLNKQKQQQKQLGKGYSIGVDSPNIGGLPEIVAYDDCSPPILYKGGGYKKNKKKSRYIKLNKNKRNKQEGGAYNFIINPKTGKKVSIYGLIGENIINNYIKELY
jgi:hypothetical protein